MTSREFNTCLIIERFSTNQIIICSWSKCHNYQPALYEKEKEKKPIGIKWPPQFFSTTVLQKRENRLAKCGWCTYQLPKKQKVLKQLDNENGENYHHVHLYR